MHYIIHKPFGYISQFKCEHNYKKLLGDLYPFAQGTMAIGRLDEDSEGLLLLTTDGKMSEEIRSKKIEKEYYAQLDGSITDSAVAQLESGIEISYKGILYKTLPCKVLKLKSNPNFLERVKKIRGAHHGPTSWISITINEGKNRQVRKMCAAAGFAVLRLIRVRIGNIKLAELQAGEVIETDFLNF